MTWEIPATGSVELKYEGLFDGDKFPDLYDLKEDHITGKCTIYTKAGTSKRPLNEEEEWTAEKTT
jgi:hypothetical protein